MMTDWPYGTYATNEAWWSMTHDERQVVLNAISALGIEPVDVLHIDFGDDSATVTCFHVTEEAGRAHPIDHCKVEAGGSPCSCGRSIGESHPICTRTETVEYPA